MNQLVTELEVEHEFTDETTGYSLDLVLRAERVAIEVDGPTHFVLDGDGAYTPTGNTMLKRRLLQSAGWCVLGVPYYRWQALCAAAQRRYLRDKLCAFGVLCT